MSVILTLLEFTMGLLQTLALASLHDAPARAARVRLSDDAISRRRWQPEPPREQTYRLGLPEADVALLAGWGVRTVGAFVALPVAAVSVRFGPRVAELHAVLHGLVKGPEHIQADLLDWYEAAPLGTVPEGAAAPAAALPSKPSNVIRVDFTRREVVRA